MSKTQENEDISQIPYEQLDIEGECTLKRINAIQLRTWKFVLFVIYSTLLIGIPVLLCYWYIQLRRWLYFDFCSLEDATHFYILNYDDTYTISEKKSGSIYHTDINSENCVYFINRFMKYYFNSHEGVFKAICFNPNPRITSILNQSVQIIGYDSEFTTELRNCYGKCAMELPRPSCPQLFLREVLQPFFLFIIYSVILWYYEKYYYYASVIAFTSAVSISINLYQVMDLNTKIYNMAYHTEDMKVLRGKVVQDRNSIDLVPGDIVFIKRRMKLPFDGILLGGSVLMNQCALTGESVPIVKKAVDKQQFLGTNVIDKSSLLYEGTELVQVCSYSKHPAHEIHKQHGLMVFVTKSNFATMKGQLIRIISFPRSRSIKFYAQSAKFVLFLFCLSIISYGILISKLQGVVETNDLVLKFFDLITITVPPGLPASMSVGIVYSINKLKSKNIYCISPDKIILGGRVEHICFDKTGTLTQDFMDFYEFVPKIGKKFYNPITLDNKKTSADQLKTKDSVQALNNMASCHSIMNLEGTDQLIGDPMEIRLFQFAGYKLTQTSPVAKNYKQHLFSFAGETSQGTVFRRFQFNSDIQRMSAIASTTANPQSAFIYTKGAPETMIKIMKEDGIPPDYKEILEKYTSCGFRVLSVASKQIKPSQIQSISREEAEKGLDFNGFQVFENKLKKETQGAIKTLIDAQISVVIITGDNPLTGSNIGFKSGVIDPYKNIMIIDFLPNGRMSVKNFYEQDNSHYVSDTMPPKTKSESDFECTVQELPVRASAIGAKGSYQFCITGPAFQQIFYHDINEAKYEFIKHIKVFARSKPIDKTRAIVIYQMMGKITAMCGDGANDCGALKQSDAGLSLSEAEASISSPFTSKTPNISSMIDLIRECRGGLATNFSLFNIMALYSLTQYTSTVITQYFYGYPADLQYLYWDIGCNFFFFLTIGYTNSTDQLSVLRPNDSLFSVGNIVSVLVMFIIQLVGQISTIIVMATQPFSSIIDYWNNGGNDVNLAKYIDNENDFPLDNYEVQAIFMFSNFMYLFSVIAFSISKPWKKPFYTNILFMIVLVIIFAYDILICLVPAARIPDFLLIEFDMRFQGLLCGMGCAFGIFMYVVQKFVMEPIFNGLREKYPSKQWL